MSGRGGSGRQCAGILCSLQNIMNSQDAKSMRPVSTATRNYFSNSRDLHKILDG